MPDEVLALRSHHVRDAHRRWQRHTYQEGPGFRFLATRGGRPPLERTPRRDLAIVRERARLVRTLREEGLGAALALGRSSRASLFRWQAAFERGGLAALVPQRCGPHVPLVKHPAWLEQVVIAVRLATYWNAKRISAELRRREIATVGQWWIERLFDDLGTARPPLRAWQPQFALAHRYQGSVLDPAGARPVPQDLPRRAGRRPLPLRHRLADPARGER